MYKELDEFLREEIFIKGNKIKTGYFTYRYNTYKKYTAEIFLNKNKEICITYFCNKLLEINTSLVVKYSYQQNSTLLSVEDYNEVFIEAIFNELKEGNFTYV